MGERKRFWKDWRGHFRRCRIALLLLILALVCALLWLNQIGLPDFVKRPLIEAIRQRGIDLQFVRLRLNFVHGLEADNVRIGGKTPDSPSLALQELQLQLDYRALMHRKFQLTGVVLRQGKFILPVTPTNEAPCTLTFDHIQTELRFQTNDIWSLDDFQASFIGAKFVLSGELVHAPAVADWQIFQHKKATAAESQAQLVKIAKTLNQIHFNRGSQLSLSVNGDARDVRSLYVTLTVNAPGAQTPWATAQDIQLVAHSVATDQKSTVASGLPCEISWKSQLANLNSEKLDADFISCDGFWRAPYLEITNFYSRLGGGEMRAGAQFDVATRGLSFTNSSCFNLDAIASILSEKTRERLGQFRFGHSPEFRGSGSLILPDWTNPNMDWDQARPTIRLQGELAVTNVTCDSLAFERARARFSYSNEVWTLPAVTIRRPEGAMEISGAENDATKEYQWHIQGPLAANSIEPFLTTAKAIREFKRFKFTDPLYVDTVIHGRLYDYNSLDASGHASLKNFVIHGEPVDSVETDFHYSNLVAEFFNPRLRAGEQTLQADGVCLDYPGDRIYFTNGLGTADPQRVANVIGRMAAQVMKPYHFLQMPTARVAGYAPLRDSTNADLDFHIVGTASLEVLNVRTPAVSGEVHWMGQTLVLTNIAASLYGGTGAGSAYFDFGPPHSTDYSFVADFQNVNLHLLATDLGSPTNHLEGIMGGHFVVSSGNSSNWRTCYGYGYANLRDGLLWDEPVFGILSPILNTVSPGMGNSRATDASARFVMNQGIISTGDLQIHTSMMRLLYTGSVDLQGKLNAHVTAELLRDVPAVGHFLSAVFWPVGKICECKVTGTWNKPQSKLVYLPTKLLLNVLHPVHAMEDLFPNQNEFNNTPKQP